MKGNMSKNGLNRRAFLRSVGSVGLSMRLMQGSALTTGMLLGRQAAAAGNTGIKRVVCVYVPDGAPVNGTNFWLPSSSLALPSVSAPLEAVKQHCVFFDGAYISDASGAEVGGHGNTSKAFGGHGFSDSFDVELERTLGASTPFSSLLLGVQSNGHGSATKKGGSEVIYQDSPVAAFNRLFNSGVNTSSVGIQRAQSILDLHKNEIADLEAILGNAEKQRLDEHLASVEKIESRLADQAQGEVNPACVSPDWNTTGFEYDSANKTRFTTEANLQMDTAVLALQCNFTNVVSIMLGNHQSEHAIPELNYTADYHQSIHGGSSANYQETRGYLTSRVAYLIESLAAATDDTGNSLLDSTLIVQSTDMGDGTAHSSTNAPIMLAGGGSAINGGSVVNCTRHTNVLDTVTEALGLTGQITQFGEGALTGVIS